MNNLEIWKKINDCDFYEVSNFGNIRSLPRSVYNGKGGFRITENKILKLQLSSSNYYCILLRYNDIKF